jgi:hypothetical protein
MRNFFFAIFLFFGVVFADFPNSTFEEKHHQLTFVWGQGTRGNRHSENGVKIEQLYSFGITYSQPQEFFRLPGRRNLEFMRHKGFGEFSRFNNWIFGGSQDVISPSLWRMYLGFGLGAYIKSEQTERISSLFTFGQKGLFGVQVKEYLRLELFARHFSNGTLTNTSSGYDFVGLSTIWNFGSR